MYSSEAVWCQLRQMISPLSLKDRCWWGRDRVQTIAFRTLLSELDGEEISHQLSLSLAGCLCAEHSPEPPPPAPSHWAHCTSRPHLVPDGWFFTCCRIVSLWPEKQTVFSHRSAFPAWIKTNPNENKMEQWKQCIQLRSNIPPTHTISASKASIHTVFLEWKPYHLCFYVPVEVWTYGCQVMHSLWPKAERAEPWMLGWGGSSTQTWVTLNPQVSVFISPMVAIMILHTPILWGNYTRYEGMVGCQDRAHITDCTAQKKC